MIALLVRKCKDKELEEQHGHGWNNNDQREKKLNIPKAYCKFIFIFF